jgi:hypothetical protein
MRVWDLPFDGDWSEVEEVRRMDTPTKRQELLNWNQGVPSIPSAYTRVNGRFLVSVQFLRLGNLLFSPAGVEMQDLNSYRSQINETAREAMSELLDVIIDLETIPGAVKKIMQECRSQLEKRIGELAL